VKKKLTTNITLSGKEEGRWNNNSID